MDLNRLSFLDKSLPHSLITLLVQEKAIKLCAVADPRLPDVAALSRQLKLLQRTDTFLFDESGSRDLHVGWPFVRGRLNDGTRVNCPLLLFPVKLQQTQTDWKLVPRTDTNISFNRTFLLALAHYNKTPLANVLLDEDFSAVNRDSTVFKTALYSMLNEHCAEIHFNPDNYRDELINFPQQTKEEFDGTYAHGQIKLYPNAVLGIFPQADSFLAPDYFQLIEQSKIESLEDFFLSKAIVVDAGSLQSANQRSVKEDKLYTPFPADPFQERALRLVKMGQSIVVQGPPGTGKSQLMANLIADALATNKKILMVCQKRAALDVVWDRLHAGGFSEFVALVHDFQDDRQHVFTRLAQQINKVSDYKAHVASIDAIQVERNYLQASNSIEMSTESLEQFRSVLFDVSECGLSAKELYLNSNPEAENVINLRTEFSQLRFDGLDALQAKVNSLGMYLSILERDSNPWRNRKPFLSLPPSALPEIKQVVQAIPNWMASVAQEVETRSGIKLDYQQIVLFAAHLDDFKLLQSVLQNPLVYEYLSYMFLEKPGEVETLWLQNQQRIVDDILRTQPEVSVPVDQLGPFQQALSQAIRSKNNIVKWIQWSLFNQDKFLIKRALIANGLSGRSGLKELENRLDNRLNLEHNLTKLRNKTWLKHMPDSYEQEKFTRWFDDVVMASRCNMLCDSMRNMKAFFNVTKLSQQEFLNLIDYFIDTLQNFQQINAAWQTYLLPRQIEELASGYASADTMVTYVADHYDTMCEYDELLYALEPTERDVLNKLLEATGYKATTNELRNLLWNSLALAWLDFLETKHPELRMPSSGRLEQLEQELMQSIARKAALCRDIILLRARERVCANLEFNRLNNLVTYRDVLHEVSKKKKLWPLRKLIQTYADDVFRLMPVWLVSPETASALFPLEQQFDLVIFDEASQCFAERGLPAMARGKQLVVAGDGQQLRPGDFFQSRWEEESEQPDEQVESLLDLAGRHLPAITLQGHYRSRAPQLVAFSNKHFYHDKLEVLPSRYWMNQAEPAIQYIKVNGQWQDQTNRVEAETIVDQVLVQTENNPEKTLGIITFNMPQQMLIMDVLEERLALLQKPMPASLFVKNIENVQGDERDIILFSIAYAPDEKGKMKAMFGSLNAAGGENRLNVAITRAREKVVVIASVLPDELVVDGVKNKGPQLLKQYLTFAWQASQNNVLPQTATPDHQKEWYLKHRLPLESCEHQFDLFPNADVVIKSDGLYAKLILTDDDYYQRSLSVRYHHGTLPGLLHDRDWRHKLFFSRNYWRNRSQFHLEVRKFLEI